MGLSIVPSGRNSKHIKNGRLPVRIEMLEHQGSVPLAVDFDVVARPGSFTDSTIANYSPRGSSSIMKFLLNEFSRKVSPTYFKGELTTKYDGVTPKQLNFDIILIADYDQPPTSIISKVQTLQSMCYPRNRVGLNPPLCLLHILHLYSLEVYVEQVNVTWHNTWNLRGSAADPDYGLPMGCDINMSVRMHQYPTREEILCGAGFDSTRFYTGGYSATLQQSNSTLSRGDKCIEDIIKKNAAYNASSEAQTALAKANRQSQAAAAQQTGPSTQPGSGGGP